MTKPDPPAADDDADDVCPRPQWLPPQPTAPMAPAIHVASVYRCRDPQQAAGLLGGEIAGYIYSRDGHPNADLLAEKLRALHGAPRAAIAASGMAALAAAVLAHLRAGDHVLASNQLYGRSLLLLTEELARLGIEHSIADACDVAAVRAAIAARTRLVVVETIANPMLRVADLAALAEIAHRAGARLLVDNTFATPVVCRPLGLGADLVLESLTKSIGGHSDAMLGALLGRDDGWDRVAAALSTWGLASSPFECWLVQRGLGTLAVRCERACANALAAAEFLQGQATVAAVSYPGSSGHPDHAVARRQFGERFGAMVAFTLRGGAAAAAAFIAAARRIPFSPSLGDLGTTLSHPASTSHRRLAPQQRAALGIDDGTIRLSVGIESREAVLDALAEGLAGVASL